MISFFHTVIALTLLVLKASATVPACSKLPYALFAPLAKHPGAQSFCTSKYPIPRPTCLFTTTVPSTKTFPATTTVAPVTVTQFVTTGEGSTVVVTNTITPTPIILTETSTVPTTVTTCAKTVVPRNDKLAPLFSSLQKQAASFVKTLCSCIATTPGCSTSTLTVRPTVSKTNTITITNLPTATVQVPNTITTTILTTLTLAAPTSTTTVTTTATSTYCAPPQQATCNPAKCSADFFCATDESCVCLSSVEGDVACSDTNVIIENCADSIQCGSSADCGVNEWCVTNLCCNDKQCITIKTDTCPNVQARSRIFRAVPVEGKRRGGNFPSGE